MTKDSNMAHNITDEEINRLAREYAEEQCPESAYKAHTEQREIDMMIEYDFALPAFQWLLRSHCIVEKSRVKEEYHEATFTLGNVDPCSETWATYFAQKSLLERLFGDTLKED